MSLIQTGTASSLPGFSSLAWDAGKMKAIVQGLTGSVAYGLGCKPNPLPASPAVFQDEMGRYGGGTVRRVDCSGLHRYLAFHCTLNDAGAGGLVLPDGSVNQNDWYGENGFKHHVIAKGEDYTNGLDPDVLYACFCRTGSRGESIGHTWFGLGKQSYESSGGTGPHSRPLTADVLVRICTDVYAIARIS